METLLKYKDHIFDLKSRVENKDLSLYSHVFIENVQIDSNAISVVMTASNRSKQTYFTLNTMSKSSYTNVHVVIVDDSDADPIDEDILQTYPFAIDFIKINRDKKCWVNPVVNYNIGFKYIRGNTIIIQNAEVCHVGDVLQFVNTHINEDNKYFVFDVNPSLNLETNERIYNSDLSSIEIYSKKLFGDKWYQSANTNVKYHFLTSMTKTTFNKIRGFSYDYTMGKEYDDNDFLLKIVSNDVVVLNVFNNENDVGGIHLFHETSRSFLDSNLEPNFNIFNNKYNIYLKSKKYIDVTECIEEFDNTFYYLHQSCQVKTVVTITGIRPDFIRMCAVFKALDKEFNHVLIHTGQHYDPLLSDVFFKQLGIRQPNYILDTGKTCSNHFEQLSYLSVAIPKLFEENKINPDLILFLGDSNSAGIAFPLKKAGYKIGHIEAGMRSYDKRMLEEINRTVCDHCSDILFVYHEDYKKQLHLENITQNVFVVGNTVVEPFKLVCNEIMCIPKRKDMILLDIHRPENFKYPHRLKNIFKFANKCIEKYNIPVKLLYFKRLQDEISKHSLDLGRIEMIPLFPYKEYLDTVYHCRFIISDSGTGQEEPALLATPVVVPRDFTERPQSYENNCSIKLCADDGMCNSDDIFNWINLIEKGYIQINSSWLGDGNTSKQIVDEIKKFFE